MPVTMLTREVTATSQIGPEEAVTQAIARVSAEMTGVKHVEVKQVEVLLHNTNVAGYRVTLEVSHEGEADPTKRREDDSVRGWSPDHPAAAQLPLGPEPLPLHADEAGVVRVGGTRVALDSVVAAF